MCDEGVGLRYLWFYLFISPQSTQRAQRFEGRAGLILGGAGGRMRWGSRIYAANLHNDFIEGEFQCEKIYIR